MLQTCRPAGASDSRKPLRTSRQPRAASNRRPPLAAVSARRRHGSDSVGHSAISWATRRPYQAGILHSRPSGLARPGPGVGDSRNQQVRDLLHGAIARASGVGQTSRSADHRGLRPGTDCAVTDARFQPFTSQSDSEHSCPPLPRQSDRGHPCPPLRRQVVHKGAALPLPGGVARPPVNNIGNGISAAGFFRTVCAGQPSIESAFGDSSVSRRARAKRCSPR